jgi:hypothetical protein
MDNPYRLKIKIGPHEFEAEGQAEVVQEQFRVFKDLIMSTPTPASTQTQNEPEKQVLDRHDQDSKPDLPEVDSRLDKIMRVNQRVVSLTARPSTARDAIILILYGHKILRQSEEVTGGEVMDGLTVTGGFSISRVDRMLESLGRDGSVIVIGERRAKRYRLTNTGANTARTVAQQVLSTVF